MTALKSLEHVDGLLRVLGGGGFGGLIRNTRSSSLLGTIYELPHRGVRFPDHALSRGGHEPGVSVPRPSHGLTHRFARRLRNTRQEGFYQRVDDRKQSLLTSVDPKNFTGQTLNSRRTPPVRLGDLVSASGEFVADSRADKSTRIQVAAVLRSVFDLCVLVFT
jgi:hypothetical protein